MPVFGYKCSSCGAREEHILLQGEKPPVKCAACGRKTLKKTFGGRLHVRLEGWGFSKTDAYLPDNRPRRDFKELRERAERLSDE
jgi:putative FmdB family regulatory protein